MNNQSTNTLERGCLLCKKDDSRPFLTKEGKSFVRCRHCGLIYQDPPPLQEENQEFYGKSYYEGFGDQNASIRQARVGLYQNFLITCRPYRRTGRLLDVGSGYGDFLKMAQEERWEAWGIEPSLQASEISQKIPGVHVLNGTIENARFPENHFDVITLWNVIDCLPDPLSALRRIYQWLAPGGLLFIRTPNSFFHWKAYQFYSFFRPLLGKMGWNKEASVFLRANFETKSLKRLLQEAGFEKLQVRNGIPTQGDAYQVFSNGSLMRAAKSLVYFTASAMDFLSGNKILLGPNLTARASKAPSERQWRPVGIRARIFLKRVILHTLAVVGYLLGLPVWRKLLGRDREIQILRYHSVSEFQQSDVSVRESQFEKQLSFLLKRYRVISLEETVKTLEKGRLPEKGTVAITFDDGYQDNYQTAYPILAEKRLPAAIFLLTTGEERERQLPHLWTGSSEQDRLLSWEQVREMSGAGITFGSHSETHVRLSQLSGNALRQENFGSKEKIESKIKKPVQFFSYPYGVGGDFDRRAELLVKEAGYQAAFSAMFGANGLDANRFALKRIGIEASDTQFSFRAKLNGALDLLSFFDLPLVRNILRQFDKIFFGAIFAAPRKSPFLLVSVDFPPHTDGVSTISRELSRRIALYGEEVMVIGPRDRGDQAFDALEPYRVFRVAGYEWGYFRMFPILLQMPWVIFRHRIRKIFAMNIAYGGILSWALSYLTGLEYLVFAYGYEFEKIKNIPFMVWLYRRIYGRAKRIVACSELVRERLIRFGVSPEKIKVLYPAVDLNRYRPLPVPREFLERHQLTGRKILLTVGRLIERKGHDRVLEALPKIIQNFPDVLYLIVGIGPHEEKLREQVRVLKLDDHVRFMGKVPEEEIVFLYNACQVFVMPSREISGEGHIEGFGIVYLEANACGKPVIGGRSGGVGEAIRDGQTGFLVDPNFSAGGEIRDKVTELLSCPEKGQALGESGLKWVRENFNWDNYARQAFELIDVGT